MREPLKVLDLFSGIGGFSLGLERTGGFKTVAFCEIEEYPRRVLAKHWPGVPIHRDVRELRAEHVGAIDVICGGYPCQPFSLAGKRQGEADDRHLWPEMRRLVDECRPSWVIGENVVGHISMGLDDVLSDLDDSEYAARAFVIPAVGLDAKHRRDRVWIVAHAECPQRWAVGGACNRLAGAHSVPQRPKGTGGLGVSRKTMAHADRERGRRGNAEWQDAEDARQSPGRSQFGQWEPEPNVGRVAHGVPSRVDRLKGLGNAVVPQIPELIGRAILEAEAAHTRPEAA